MGEHVPPEKISAGEDKAQPLCFYEFFAGVGMARLGLEPQWTCAWANDIDPKKSRIYKHNFGADHLDVRDVALVAAEVQEGQSGSGSPPFPKSLHMAWASFPCQDLSLAGWRRGMSAGRSGAYWPFWKLMHALEERPPIMVIENVAGLLYGDDFLGLCESLAALGMRFGSMLIDARHFLPQSRPRVFVIAVDGGLQTDDFEDPHPETAIWFSKSVFDAYERLPKALRKHWVWWRLSKPSSFSHDMADFIETHPEDVSWNSQEVTEKLLDMMTAKNRKKVEAAVNSGGLNVGFLYKRMRNGVQRAEIRFDGVSGCLRTPKGGSSRQTIVIVEGDRVRSRLMSRIEAARFMGIPLNDLGQMPGSSQSFFPEDCSYNQAYMAMGDGVAVPVVRHLALEILTPLARKWQNEGLGADASGRGSSRYLKKVGARIQVWESSNSEKADVG